MVEALLNRKKRVVRYVCEACISRRWRLHNRIVRTSDLVSFLSYANKKNFVSFGLFSSYADFVDHDSSLFVLKSNVQGQLQLSIYKLHRTFLFSRRNRLANNLLHSGKVEA
jgi:hypothetical protein